MSRLLLPILLVGAALGLFVLYTNPVYQEVKVLRAQTDSYDEALNKSQELRAVRDELLAKRNTFPAESVSKLERVLPDNVDNIRLIIDINNIAARHGITLSDVALDTDFGDKNGPRSSTASGPSGEAVGSVTVGFSVAASYENFLTFLSDIEHSLRIVDIENLSFKVPSEGLPTYVVSIRTYWLR